MATALPKPGDPETLYVIDISSYVFRAYHALPPLSNSKGEPTHAVAGVANMLARLVKERKPASLVVAMDSPKGSFRKDRYPAYKANRPPAPPDLKPQIVRVREMVDAWGMNPIEVDAHEADDLIATVVRRCRDNKLRVVIVSADKDLLQLVGPDVTMYDTMRDRVMGPPETEEKMGVPPEQVRDLLALMGDSSDNVPGIPSVGQKTAAKLLQQWGSIEGIYENLEAITRKALKAKLQEHRESLKLSRELVSLRDQAPLELDVTRAGYSGGDATRLRKLFTELEFTRLLAQLEPAPSVEGHYQLIENEEELRRAARATREAGRLAFFTVLDRDDPIQGQVVGVALSWAAGVAAYLPIAHRAIGSTDQLTAVEAEEVLRPLLTNSLFPKVCRYKREATIWARRDVSLRGVSFDPTIASYLLDPGRHAHELEDIARHELDADLTPADRVIGKGKSLQGWDLAELEAVSKFANERADFLFRLNDTLSPRMGQGEFHSLYYDVEMPLARVLATMEATGIRVDTALLEGLAVQAGEDLQRLEQECTALAGHPFNVSSPRQLETILFDELDLPVIKKTKTSRSTDQQVLEELALLHGLPEAILEHRSLAKLKSTYLDALPREVNAETGRIHTRYNQLVAATGRLSSSDPNLQNIPIRTEMGRKIREAFVPRQGWAMFAADYSQIELRVLAHLSQDKELVDAFSAGADVHVRTATALFQVDAADVTRKMRDQAKTVNFAVIYGQTQFALARNLRIERSEAKRYIDAFFTQYAGVKRFMDETVEAAREHGYVTTLLGRRRTLADIRSRNPHLRAGAERIARNTPIQGTAADIMKVAMVRIQDHLDRRGMQSHMILTVHDELVFEAPPEEEETLEPIVVELMQQAVPLSVPLPVDVGWGPNWGAAH